MKNNISLDQYNVFYTVAKCGSMSAAAQKLFISQPAVSMAVTRLEKEYGGRLFTRGKGGVTTTPEGKMLYEHLQRAFTLIEQAENTYEKMQKLQSGEIHIGASDTLSMGYLLTYLERFHSNYPEIHIKVTNRTTPETIELLRSGQVEIGFINLPYKITEDIEVTPCFTIHDCLIGGSRVSHLKAGINFANLKDLPLLMLEKESNTRRYLDSVAEIHGITLTPNIELGSSDLLLQFAKINLGVAFVIREFAIKNFEGKVFEIPLDPPVPSRSIGLIKQKNNPCSIAARQFMDLLVDTAI